MVRQFLFSIPLVLALLGFVAWYPAQNAAAWADDSEDEEDEEDEEAEEDEDDGEPDDEADDDDTPDLNASLPAATPRLTYGKDNSETYRRGELSAARLTQRDLRRLQQAGFHVIRRQSANRIGQGIVARLETPKKQDARAALRLARRLVPSGVFDLSHLYGPSAQVYGRKLTGMPRAHACVKGGRIGMIDGAITRHPSLKGSKIQHKSFSAGKQDSLHGTAVLSVLAGAPPRSTSALNGTRVYAASVFTNAQAGQFADVIDLVAALNWQVQNRVEVVNMSLTGPDNALLREAVLASARAGLIIVAAAGNGGASGQPRYPAAYSQTIAVAAIDARGRAYKLGSRGRYIDIAAPGVDVWGAHATSGGDALWTGTSFAAPFVTLELAAARKAGGIQTVEHARAHLARSARDLGPAGKDPRFGHGLMQATACR